MNNWNHVHYNDFRKIMREEYKNKDFQSHFTNWLIANHKDAKCRTLPYHSYVYTYFLKQILMKMSEVNQVKIVKIEKDGIIMEGAYQFQPLDDEKYCGLKFTVKQFISRAKFEWVKLDGIPVRQD